MAEKLKAATKSVDEHVTESRQENQGAFGARPAHLAQLTNLAKF
jgi:hypothetical protein